MLTRLIRSRQFFITLWFLAYFVWVQPGILERLSQAPEQRNLTLALILVSVQIMELVGVWLKFPAVLDRVEANRAERSTQFVTIFLVLTHIFVTALLALTTIKLFGVDLDNDGFLNGLAGLTLFFLALAKEGLFLVGWFRLMGARNYQLPPIPAAISPHIAEIMGDGLLAIFSALAYTVVWEQIATDSFIIRSLTISSIVDYLGAALFFLMVFPATRSLYYTEELLTERPIFAVRLSWALLLVTMLAALVSIPKI